MLIQGSPDILRPPPSITDGIAGVGYDYATAQGGIGAEQYYRNIANWITQNNPTAQQLAEAMQTWGVTPEDVAAASAYGLVPQYGAAAQVTAQDVAAATGVAAEDSSPTVYTSSSQQLIIPADIESATVAQKVDFYQRARADGWSDSQIRQAAEAALGRQPDDVWAYLVSKSGYASPQIAAAMEDQAAAQAAAEQAALIVNEPVAFEPAPSPAVTYVAPVVAPAPAPAPAVRVTIPAPTPAPAPARAMAPTTAPAPGGSTAMQSVIVPANITTWTANAKAAWYRAQRGAGFTDADIRAAAEAAVGDIPDADWAYLVNLALPELTATTPAQQGGAGLLIAAAAAYFLLG